MTEDDEPEDPQLTSLRAVWLSLPDEEPPSRGLDALMAAARVKAEEMATPPWWKRVMQMLRRPPVLALASIMVLIGGAVLISSHKRADEAMPTTSDQPSQGAGVQPPAAPAVVPPPADEGQRAPEMHQEPEGAHAATPPAEAPKPPPAERPHHVSPRSPELAKEKVDATTKGAARPSGETAAPGFEGDKKADSIGAADDGVITKDPAPAQDSKATRAPGRVMVDQLLVQCRSAAARGDCEAAKLIARRIASQDAAYYRDHVASDATIQKCIAAQ